MAKMNIDDPSKGNVTIRIAYERPHLSNKKRYSFWIAKAKVDMFCGLT